MEFNGTKWYFIWRHQGSMEFYGIFHGIRWNTCVIWNGVLLIPWNRLELGDFLPRNKWFCHFCQSRDGIGNVISPERCFLLPTDTRIPTRNTVPTEYIKNKAVYNLYLEPWNSMELSDISFGGTRVPWNSMEYSMEFDGTLVSFQMAFS